MGRVIVKKPEAVPRGDPHHLFDLLLVLCDLTYKNILLRCKFRFYWGETSSFFYYIPYTPFLNNVCRCTAGYATGEWRIDQTLWSSEQEHATGAMVAACGCEGDTS